MIQYTMLVINSVVKLGEEECEKCGLPEKHLHDYYRLSQAQFYEICVGGGGYVKKFDVSDDYINFAKNVRVATSVRSLS